MGRGLLLSSLFGLLCAASCGLTTHNPNDPEPTGAGGVGTAAVGSGGTSSAGSGAMGGDRATGGDPTTGGVGGNSGGDGGGPGCAPDDCFCELLGQCSSDSNVTFHLFGTRGWKMCGREGGECVVMTFEEVEHGVTLSRCRVPSGDACTGSSMVGPDSFICEVESQCALGQDCPADLLSCEGGPDSPSCQPLDSGFPDCPLQEGYGFDGTGCVLTRACVGLVYATREDCWDGCGRSCQDVSREAAVFREENSACETANDCQWVPAIAPPFDHCSCLVALNTSASLPTWSRLNYDYGCFEAGTCCLASPGPPQCIDGHCAAE